MSILAPARPLEVRWLGRVPYREAWDLQRAFWTARTTGRAADTLLLVEHPRTYTLGRTAHEANLGAGRATLEAGGAEVLDVDRGGDVTYHGPGQLVGYPILDLTRDLAEGRRIPDLHAYLRDLEEALIRALATFGLDAYRRPGYTGVWLPAGKVAAIGVKVTRGVSMHGFALNVDPVLADFAAINPCGIGALGVTSIAAALGRPVTLADVVDPVVAAFAAVFGGDVREARVAWARGAGAGTPVRLGRRPTPRPPQEDPRRPEWMRVRARFTDDFHRLKALVHGADLHTVCEEAGCPNIYECWADGTATLMILGDTCTRACGFCKVTTGRPPGLDLHEPERAADAVAAMGLRHAVVTSVARDDLADGGAAIFAETIAAIRRRVPGCAVEVLIPDFKGDPAALQTVLDAKPDVLNHNLETVARLQRDVRPNAGYARSLALLARAKAAGAVTKSGLIAGMGETVAELETALSDLATAGVDIVTLGQYLRPSAAHRPVDRFLTPDEFAALAAYAERHGIGHCEAGPLVRSSYHARQAAAGIA